MPEQTSPGRPQAAPSRIVRGILAASRAALAVERRVLGALMGLLVLLILVNVATRYAGAPIYWIDEAAVYTVVWLTFVGASIMTRLRLDFSMDLLTDKLGTRGVRIARVAATCGVLSFGLSMVLMCWLWMDPVGIARYGFDAHEYAADSFNFLYTVRTQTLNWPVWAVQLVLPIFALTLTLHALANLCEDMALAPRQAHPEFPVSRPEMVN